MWCANVMEVHRVWKGKLLTSRSWRRDWHQCWDFLFTRSICFQQSVWAIESLWSMLRWEHTHPEGGSTDSDKYDSMKEFWLEFQHGHLWEFFFTALNCSEKWVILSWKMICNNFLYRWGDLNDGETFLDLLLEMCGYSVSKIEYFQYFFLHEIIWNWKKNSMSFWSPYWYKN